MAKRKTTTRKPTPKKGGGGNILMLFVGILLGIVIAFGGVAASGYYVATNHGVKSTTGIVNKYIDPDFNYAEYIAEEYASKSYVELVLSLADTAKELGGENGNLNTLKKISPYVDKVVDQVLKAAKDAGLNLDKDEFMSTSFKDYPTYLKEEAGKLELGGLLNTLGVKSSPLLDTICYGVENVDYIEDSDGKIVMLGDSKPTTIDDFMTGGLDGVIEEIPLDALIEVEPSSSIEMSLFYGKSNRYDFNESKGVADMRQMVYTQTGGVFFDIDGNPVVTAQTDGVYTITDGDETYYLLQQTTTLSTASASPIYFAWRDKEGTLPARYPKTTVGDMQHDTDGLINGIELGELFGVSPFDDDVDELLLSIAYGEEGTHYRLIDVTGDGKNDSIVWLFDEKGNRYAPNTIATLMEDDGLMNLMNDVKLGTVLDISPLDPYQGKETPDDIMLLLAYGEEGTHYRLDDTNSDGKLDKIEWLTDENGEKYSAKTIGDLTDSDESMFNAFSLATVLDVDGASAGIMKAIAFGNSYCYTVGADGKTVTMNAVTYTVKDGKAYDYRKNELGSVSLVDDENGVYSLTTADDTKYLKETDGKYYVYATQASATTANAADRAKYQKRTLEDLMGENAENIINEIELAVVLDITPSSEPIMIALAYGKEGKNKDFVYELDKNGKKIGFIPINAPKTIEDLKNNTTLFDSIELATVLNITPDSEPVMIALAYGKEGKDFNYDVDENGKKIGIIPINDPKTVGDLKTDKTLFDNIELATALNINVDSEPVMIALAYGKEGKDKDFVYELDENGKKIGIIPINDPKTIGDLKTDKTLFDSIELATVLNITPDSESVMIALAYGKEGTDFKYDVDENGKKIGFIPLNDPKTVGDLKNDKTLFDNIELATVLNITPSSQPIMIALAYGKEGTDFNYDVDENGKKIGFVPLNDPKTIYDLRNDPNVFNNIELAAIFEELDANDKIMMFLLYGKEGIHYSMDGKTPVPMQRRIAVYNGVPYDVYGKPMPGASISDNIFTDVDGKTYTMTLVADGTATKVLLHSDSLQSLADDGSTETEIYADYYYLSDAKGKVYFTSRTLGDLTKKDSKVLDNMTYALTVGDVLRDDDSIQENFLLKHVADVVIADLPDRILSLTFKEVYAQDIYHRETIDGVLMYQYRIGEDDYGYIEKIYYNRQDHTYHATEDLSTNALDLVLEPEWEYLLTEEDHIAHDYAITEFSKLTDNMKNNVQKATLFELYDHGLIQISKEDGGRESLERTIVDPDNPTNFIQLGDLTITELINAIPSI